MKCVKCQFVLIIAWQNFTSHSLLGLCTIALLRRHKGEALHLHALHFLLTALLYNTCDNTIFVTSAEAIQWCKAYYTSKMIDKLLIRPRHTIATI